MDDLKDTIVPAFRGQNLKPDVRNHIKTFSKLISIIDNFFINKEYSNNGYISILQNKIKNDCKIDISNKRLSNLLLSFHNNKNNYDKINKMNKTINIEINKMNPQIGGFIYDDNDNKYAQVLNMIDFIFDLINIIPNNIITQNYNFIAAPYGIIAVLLNLLRGNYDFAFYSFIGLIPGIGGALAGSIKIIHRIINYISSRNIMKNAEEYYKQLQAAKRVHDYLKDETFEKINNPFIGDFEDNYKYDDYFNDEIDIS
jgi:hypothetical protein